MNPAIQFLIGLVLVNQLAELLANCLRFGAWWTRRESDGEE